MAANDSFVHIIKSKGMFWSTNVISLLALLYFLPGFNWKIELLPPQNIIVYLNELIVFQNILCFLKAFGIVLVFDNFAFGWHKMWSISKMLEAVNEKIKDKESHETIEILDKQIDVPFRIAYENFKDSLYPEREINQDGEEVIVRYRLTETSDCFFTNEKIIDQPSYIGVFKHFPGIYTSLGIIGTFFGLTFGLSQFDLSVDANIQNSVDILLNSVRDAFVVSMMAIGAAVVTTLFERILYNIASSKLSDFCKELDSKFESGVANELMQDLVKYSEESVTQGKQIKDAFIGELRELLQKNAEQQGQMISRAILDTFKGSLDELVLVLRETKSTDSSNVAKLMENALNNFSQSLGNNMGSQFDQFAKTVENSCASIDAMQSSLQLFLHKLREETESSHARSTALADANMGKSTEVLHSIQQAVSALTLEMKSVSSDLHRTTETFEQAVGSAGEKLLNVTIEAGASLSEDMTNAGQRMLTQATEQQRLIQESMANTFGQQQSAIDSLSSELNKFSITIDSMSNSFASKVENSSGALAENIAEAADILDESLEKYNEAITKNASLSDKLEQVTNNLAAVIRQTSTLQEQYHEAIIKQTEQCRELQNFIEDAKAESISRESMLEQLQELVGDINSANEETARLAENAGTALQDVFEKFAIGIEQTGANATQHFDRTLSSAYSKLDSSVNQLNSTFEELLDELTRNRDDE